MAVVFRENFNGYASGTALSSAGFTVGAGGLGHVQLFNNSGTQNSSYVKVVTSLTCGSAAGNGRIFSGNVAISARYSSNLASADPSYGGASISLNNPNGWGAAELGGYLFGSQRAGTSLVRMPGYSSLGSNAGIPAAWSGYTLYLEKAGAFVYGALDGVPKFIARDTVFGSGTAGNGMAYDTEQWSSNFVVTMGTRNVKTVASFGHSYVQGSTGGDYDGNGYRYTFYNYLNSPDLHGNYFFVGNLAQGSVQVNVAGHNGVTDGKTGDWSTNMVTMITNQIANCFPNPDADCIAMVGPIEYNDAANSVALPTFYANVLSGVALINTRSPLIKIFIVTGGMPQGSVVNVVPYADQVRQVYRDTLALGYNVYLVDWATQAAMTDWSSDHIHPSNLGYKQMGSYLAAQVESTLNPTAGPYISLMS